MLTKEQVNEIVKKNRNNEKIASIELYASDNIGESQMKIEDVVVEDSLTRFDTPIKKNKKRRKKKKGRNYGKSNAAKKTQ